MKLPMKCYVVIPLFWIELEAVDEEEAEAIALEIVRDLGLEEFVFSLEEVRS